MKLKLNFSDFDKEFDPESNFFTRILRQRYEVEIAEQPELLIYSNYGVKHLDFRCAKIFFSGENVRPDFGLCDFSFSFDYGGQPANYRLPLYVLHGNIHDLTKGNDVNAILSKPRNFCNFVYSNPRAQERIRFFNLLSQYKKVDAAGSVLNNMGGKAAGMRYDYESKLTFLRQYKFTIAFENEAYPGYTTEKIIHPMKSGSIPIYWGNPSVNEELNPESFISVRDYATFDAAIERIVQIDQDDELYRKYLSQPYFHHNTVPPAFTDDAILEQFDKIFKHLEIVRPISSTFQGWINLKRKKVAYLGKKVNYKIRQWTSPNLVGQ